MKILYVGHTYTVRANQAKILALAHLPGVEITLVTPHAWRGPLYSNRADLFDSSQAPNVRHHILHSAFIGKESAYLYSPSIFPSDSKLKTGYCSCRARGVCVIIRADSLGAEIVQPEIPCLIFHLVEFALSAKWN